jgi:hypothetical protein
VRPNRRRAGRYFKGAGGGRASWKGSGDPWPAALARSRGGGGFELERNGCIGMAGRQPTATPRCTRVALHPQLGLTERFPMGR